ncbi:hypothetical protein BDM02DRAFT_3088957, partial [Thelephora ganbajun]
DICPHYSPVKVVRARVWRACEVCRKRKIKCDGQEPCAYCLSSGKTCSFKEINDNAAGARQYAITVDNRLARVEEAIQRLMPMAQAFENWMETNDQKLPWTDNALVSTVTSSSSTSHPLMANSVSASGASQQPPAPTIHSYLLPHSQGVRQPSSGKISSPAMDRLLDDDVDGANERWSDRFSFVAKDSYGNLRFIGGTSSMMLVEALNSLNDSAPLTGSPASSSSDRMPKATVEAELPFFKPNYQFRRPPARPLPEQVIFPSTSVADELITTYFTYIHHTFPILHQQSFVNAYVKVMEARAANKGYGNHPFLSCLFAVFACASTMKAKTSKGKSPSPPPSSVKPVDPPPQFHGMDYYESSQVLFWMSSGASQIEHVQALALQAICNASWNTLATSWINAGQALRRAQDIGLHRSPRRLQLSSLEKEIRRRVWWCVYGLDRVLSMALGRPSGANDDDCDVELPVEIDDGQLQSSAEGNTLSPGENFMTGFIWLTKIYIIAGKIARQLQSSKIEDPSKDDQMSQTVRALDRELAEWVENLPHNVRHATNNRKNPKMLALCLTAFFVYHSAIINLHRPLIPDSDTSTNDLSSLKQCISAAKSCLRIGEMVKEMLPTSHHLAFAVQYITLSGVLLLRCVAYGSQAGLVEAVIVDAEKCVELLEGMEGIWNGAERCREIVSDLLVVVKTRHYGGLSALDTIQTTRGESRSSPHTLSFSGKISSHSAPPESSQGKRKSPPEFEVAGSRSRPRLDGPQPQHISWASRPNDHRRECGGAPQLVGNWPSQHQGGNEPTSLDSVTQQRLSNVRTPVDHDAREQQSQYHHGFNTRRMSGQVPGVDVGQMPSIVQHSGNHVISPQHPPYQETPRISLDLNALSAGQEIDGLPFSGYDFLGGDVYALLGSVFRPQNEQLPAHYEANSQMLWQAYGQAGSHLGQE